MGFDRSMLKRRFVQIGIVTALVGFQFMGGEVVGQEIKVEKIADDLVFPEGPVWHPDGYLLFSDVHDYKIMKIKPGGGAEVWFDQKKKTNGLIMSNDGKKIYACCYSERELLEIDARTKKWRVLAREFGGREFNNVNDVAIDADGNVFFTDPKWGSKKGDVQGVYCYRTDGVTTLAAVVENQPNGLVVTPDQKWLFVDRSGGHDVWRYKLGKGGALSEGMKWADLEAEPDGMTLYSRGNLYVALAGNGKVCVLSPEGKILRLVQVVNRMATNVEFEDGNESVLYVTCGGKEGERTGSVHKIIFPKDR